MASVYILGAGAMGSLWATHLHQAFHIRPEHRVRFLTTRKQVESHREFSLKSPFLSEKQTDFNITLDIAIPADIQSTQPAHSVYILVCTKSYHALDALLALKPYLAANCSLILFQNGLGSQHQILEAFPDIPIFAAVSTEGVNRKAKNHFIHAGKGLTRIGPLNNPAKQTKPFDLCMQTLSHPGLETQALPDIWPALWEKLAINCAINPFTAILNCPNGEIKSSALFQEYWPELKQELCAMLEQAGMPLSSEELETRVFQVIENTRSNISSMLQDVRANRKTEIEDINGFAARYLAERKINHSTNQTLMRKVMEITQGYT